jgi:hypothetical protein
LAGGLTCCGLPFLLGPVAWILGHKGIVEVDAQPGVYGGRESLVAGRVLGMISTALILPWLILLGLYFFGTVASIRDSGY